VERLHGKTKTQVFMKFMINQSQIPTDATQPRRVPAYRDQAKPLAPWKIFRETNERQAKEPCFIA
jgi:hypothetical protein